MIHDLLVPTDEARNEHKRLQLRELAALNGASWVARVHKPRPPAGQRGARCWLSGEPVLLRPEHVSMSRLQALVAWYVLFAQLAARASAPAMRQHLARAQPAARAARRHAEGRPALLLVRPERAPAV